MDIKRYFNLKTLMSLGAFVALSFNQVMAADDVAKVAEDAAKNEGLGKMVSYYLLLFLLVCVFVGIVGKILQVYELTRKIQGKKDGIRWDRVNGILFGLILIAGLYGT